MTADRISLLIVGTLMFGIGVGFLSGIYYSGKLELPEIEIANTQDKNLAYKQALNTAGQLIASLSAELETTKAAPPKIVVLTPTPYPHPEITYINAEAKFTGEDLWQSVNKYRREHGVPELQLHSELCQLSSHRLGEILNLGRLDNHEGFERYFDDHSVSDFGLTNVAENLASGYSTAEETVAGWDSSPPHRTFLLADGSYKYGCTSANLGFSVLIGGF